MSFWEEGLLFHCPHNLNHMREGLWCKFIEHRCFNWESKRNWWKIVVYLFEDINKAKKKRGHLLGGQSSAAKKFSTTFWSRPPLKRWKVFIIFILWVRLRMTKFNCGETKGRLLWRCEPGDVYKFKYQISNINHQVSNSRTITWGKRVWKGIHVQVQVSSIVYQVSNIKHQVSLLGDASPERYWRISSFLSFAKPCGLGGGVMERWKGVDVVPKKMY